MRISLKRQHEHVGILSQEPDSGARVYHSGSCSTILEWIIHPAGIDASCGVISLLSLVPRHSRKDHDIASDVCRVAESTTEEHHDYVFNVRV